MYWFLFLLYQIWQFAPILQYLMAQRSNLHSQTLVRCFSSTFQECKNCFNTDLGCRKGIETFSDQVSESYSSQSLKYVGSHYHENGKSHWIGLQIVSTTKGHLQ